MFSIFKKKTVVPHVRLTGIIGSAGRFRQGMDLAGQKDILKKAFSLKKISHVAISINSPGGSPVQSHLIYSYIRELADKKKVKVLIFAEDVAASGGYLISCAGDEIYANSSSIIGSIGVISASFGFKDLIQKIGVERRVYTAGKNKSTLDPFVEEKEEDVKRLKSIQLELHDDFIKVVETSRGSKLKDPEKNNIFTGEFWTGKTALTLGLIDGIGNADQVLKEKFGDKVVIKKFETATKKNKKPIGIEKIKTLTKDLKIPWFAIGGIKSNNISHLKRNGFKKVALVSQLMNSEDPKEDAIMILKELSHEN